MSRPLHVDRLNRIATITPDWPDTGNAIDVTMAEAFRVAALDYVADGQCVVSS